MRIGWLIDDPGYVGGAEMTAAEFRAAAPADIEIVDCPPGEIVNCDRYVAHNVANYRPSELDGRDVIKYAHDVYPYDFNGAREWLVENARWIFCSPIQRDRMRRKFGVDGECVPPALDLSAFRQPRQDRRNGDRRGTCSIAQWRNPGKGPGLIAEYARNNDEQIDVYGPGPCLPNEARVNICGELEPGKIAQTLWRYSRFVFLPVELEPFCRTAVEAWAAGCEVVVNGLIGARHYLEGDAGALDTAAEDFWIEVLA